MSNKNKEAATTSTGTETEATAKNWPTSPTPPPLTVEQPNQIAQKPFVMHLMTLAECGVIHTRLAKAGFAGDQIFARRPVGTGGNDLGADYLDEAIIREQGLANDKLYYLLKTINSMAPEFDAYAQGALLATGVNGFARIWAERNPGKSSLEAYGAVMNIPSVYAAVQTALQKL